MSSLVKLNDGKVLPVLNDDDIVDIVKENLSEELSNIIKDRMDEQKAEKEFLDKKFNSDMDNYELELELLHNELEDTRNVITSIISEIEKSSRIRKQKILNDLKLLETELTEYL